MNQDDGSMQSYLMVLGEVLKKHRQVEQQTNSIMRGTFKCEDERL